MTKPSPKGTTKEPNNTEPNPPLLQDLRSGTWLDQQEFPPLEYAVPGLIPEGLSLLVGPPKAGKSWLILNFALSVAGAFKALKKIQIPKSRPVLYLALEDGDRRMQQRCRTVLEGKKIPEDFYYMTRLQPAMLEATLTTWIYQHRDRKPLVILDTLGKVMPQATAGESTYQRDYRIGSMLKNLADEYPGTSLIALHHDRKAQSDDFVDAVSGTHGLAGSADTILLLERSRQHTNALLKGTGRDVQEAGCSINSEGDGIWYLEGDTLEKSRDQAFQSQKQDTLGDLSLEILAFINEKDAEVTTQEIINVFGVNSKQNLTRLVQSERIERAGRGKYKPVREVTLTKSGKVLGTMLAQDGEG